MLLKCWNFVAVEEKFTQKEFCDEFSNVVKKGLKDSEITASYAEKHKSLRVERYVKKQSFPRIDTYFCICDLFKICAWRTLIDIIVKFIPKERIIKYLQDKPEIN